MKKLSWIFLLVLLYSCTEKKEQTAQPTTIDLTINWEFQQAGTDNWYPATVPGVVHTDLLVNQLIPDPFWENNEQQLQWIEKEDWNYRTTFNLTKEQLQNQHLEIEFEGLDTYAKVTLNGQEIITATNMFRTWKAEVKSLLKVGENKLEVAFTSPLKYNQEKYENYPHVLPSGSEITEPRVGSFTRKAAYQFGWDWGPRMVTCGIWRPVKLNSWNDVKIANIYCKTESISGEKAKMKAQLTIETDLAEPKKFIIAIDGNKMEYTLKNGSNTINYDFEVEKPQLWWCNGLGDAHLYELKVEVLDENNLKDSKSEKYGIRTIELINEPDSIGTSFYFKLNGKPVFMKGANYIPQDVFLPRVTTEKYTRIIGDVKAANMNMLRVWGGGIYENDIFYDLCDENGILVWQDFMFAGSLYPNDPAFAENVKQEVKENIIRLRNHPCIALWCGNNEIEVAWKNWGWQKQYNYSAQDSTEIWEAYVQLFQKMIPEQVALYDSERNYTSTSPLSNWGTAENFNHGSMHYWGVWHGREPFENFEKNVGRFMVEYGFQSFPCMETIQTFASDSSLNLASETMKNRQKSYIGNGLISKHIEQYFDAPKSFEEFVNLSQQTQAKGMEMAIREHLNNQPHCMGTLFWQLNDCWPGPSWSVIDYYGQHKVAYETVKKEYQP